MTVASVSQPTTRLLSHALNTSRNTISCCGTADRTIKNLINLMSFLAFPDENLPFIKKGVVRRQSIADEGLRPIEKASERPKIKTDVRLGSIVKCVMRYGLLVVGEKVWDSRFYMVLRVGWKKGKGGKILIAYKHALLDFHVLKEAEKRKKRFRDDWDDENTRRG